MKKKIGIITSIIIVTIVILFLVLNQSKIFTNLSLNDTKTSNSVTQLTSATIPTYYVDDDYEIDSSYGWAYKFISGVTEVETFGFTTYSEDYYSYNTSYTAYSETKYAICRITSDSQKGNIGIIYHNVGTYQGQVISLKITVTDWDGFQTAGTCTVDGVTYPNYPYVSFKLNEIACMVSIGPVVLNPEFKLEFVLEDSYVDVNTYDTVTVKGHETMSDVDGPSSSSYDYGEYFYVTDYDGIDKMLLTEDSNIKADGLKYYGTVNKCDTDEFEWWLTMLFETDSFSLTYR